MDEQGRDITDASSIKPVSSLRSHFEQLNKTPNGKSPQSRSQSPNPRIQQPRQNSPAPPLGVDSQQQKHWQNGHGVSLSSVTDAVRLRPLFTGPNVATQRSPAVTIEPPSSPPKPLNHGLTLPSPPDYLTAETPKTPSSSGISLSRHFRIPSRPHTPLVEQRKSPLLSPSAAPQAPEPPPPRRSGEFRRDATANILTRPPPPINRSEKPKIPAKHNSLIGHITEKETVPQASTHPNIYRQSTFSPSPSRGASPDRGFMLPPPIPYRQNTQETSVVTKSTAAIFIPTPIHPAAGKRRDYELNGNGVNSELALADSSNEHRPVLPARPGFPPPIKTPIDHSKGPRVPVSDSDGQQVFKYPVQASRPAEDNNSPSPNPKRNISTPASKAPTPPRSHSRAVTVDQSSMQASARSQSSFRTTPEVSDTSTSRLSHATPLNTAVNVLPISLEYPDPSRSNRRPPYLNQCTREIPTKFDARLFDAVGEYVCSTGIVTRVWSLVTGEQIFGIVHGETIRIVSVSFKASSVPEDEGQRLWLGNNVGDLLEVEIASQSVVATKSAAHSRHEVIKIYRHLSEMWTLDDVGTLHVWAPDVTGSPSFDTLAQTFRIPKGHTFSIVIGDELWYATGKDLRVFHPSADEKIEFQLLQRPLCQLGAGEIVSGATIISQPDRVYFGHTDGKVTIYSRSNYACLGTVNVSMYKINSLAGVGQYLWAGYSTGMVYVYDTAQTPWAVKKDWRAHDNPVIGVLADRTSFYKLDRLQVISLGADNMLRQWDGLLRDDWLENEMQTRGPEFCTFENIKLLVMTWNAGASTPHSLRYSDQDSNFVRDLLQSSDSPDILIFGFQELVDLEDKKATAMSFFKSKKKDKDNSEHEHMSRQYREWRDYLIRCLDDYMPKDELYHLLQSSTLVGLFTCIFVKSHLRERIKSLSATEVKRGMGGLHGNKGALIVRFIIDDTSMCFVNCHLAAGQTQTKMRNHDISAILESTILPVERDPDARLDSFISGGDGSMILDHEVCIVNGDLNYRIDTMGRDAVVSAVKAGNLEKLLERDQLLVSKRKNPGFRLRAFQEMPITFNPTYKYDVGSDTYDTSEKKRAPAWCDRILYRDGHITKRIKQFDYRRHEVRVSDHRPVSALFEMTIKSILPRERAATWNNAVLRFEEVKKRLLRS